MNRTRGGTTCPIGLFQIVLQGGEWTQDMSTTPTGLPAGAGSAGTATDEEVLFILDLVVKKKEERRKEGKKMRRS